MGKSIQASCQRRLDFLGKGKKLEKEMRSLELIGKGRKIKEGDEESIKRKKREH